jgi:hypothetical protein
MRGEYKNDNETTKPEALCHFTHGKISPCLVPKMQNEKFITFLGKGDISRSVKVFSD